MLFVAVLHCTAMDTLFIPPGFSWDYSPSTMRNDSIMIVVVAVNKRSGIVIGLLIYSPPESRDLCNWRNLLSSLSSVIAVQCYPEIDLFGEGGVQLRYNKG